MFDAMDVAHSIGKLDKFVECVLLPVCFGQKVGDVSIQLFGQDSRSVLLPSTLEKLRSFKSDYWVPNVLHSIFDLYKSGELPPVLAKFIERYKDSPTSVVASEPGADAPKATSETTKKASSAIDYGSYEPLTPSDDKQKSDGASEITKSEGLTSVTSGAGAGYTLPDFELDF